MKRLTTLFAVLSFQTLEALAFPAAWPFAPPAGQSGSTAIHLSDNAIVSWADGYQDVQYGGFVLSRWKTPAEALGPAEGNSTEIVCLGRGGRITMTFAQGISDGSGFDFAVFENAFDDYFLELGWVEVSSDGTNFVRFPNYSYTPASPETFYARDIYGLASKYRQGYGTPFDLAELQWVSDAIVAGTHSFTNTYVDAFTNSFPALDLSNVKFVRIIDVVGDGSARDSEGFAIYDPYPTSGSAGFDLDAIAVLNQPPPNGAVQTITFDPIPHQKLAFGSIELQAVSDSGLPVFFTLQSGPAALVGNVLTLTGTGVVEVVARQGGDAIYAPASPVLRPLHVAEKIQHIFVEPLPNQIQGSGSVQVNAYASSGLPVLLEVYEGPAAVMIGETNHVLDLASETGEVALRAFQPGDATTAPATDVFIDFQIVEVGASNAPIAFADWLASNAVPEVAIEPGTDAYGQPAMVLDFTLDRRASAYCRVGGSADLAVWTNTVPEIVDMPGDPDFIHLTVQFPADVPHHYYRLIFEEQ